jgi:beta-phosphoglucomutase-like phosphatase (HAD superfamily)
VTRALDALGAATDESVLVGDSPSDIDAGREPGIATIGYANKTGKQDRPGERRRPTRSERVCCSVATLALDEQQLFGIPDNWSYPDPRIIRTWLS